ncbi:MAG: preprotein translocase subunit SecD [Candidatus Deianiraeaceae bacterium]|jgi:preprotein translocase subunit SecD
MKTTKLQILTLIFALAVAGILTMSNFVRIPFAQNSKITLGLDLQGGTDILLKVDINEYIEVYKKNLVYNIKKELYSKKVGYKKFHTGVDNFSFEIRKIEDVNISKKVLKNLRVKFKENGGVFSLDVSSDTLRQMKKKVLEQSIEVIRNRIDEVGNKEIIIHGVDDDKISLQIPGENNSQSISKLLNTQAKLTFHLMDGRPFVEKKGEFNPNVSFLNGENKGYYYAILNDVIIDGADLDDASATITENGEAAVSFSFNSLAARAFGGVTSKNIGRPFAIVLDGKVLSAPNIKEPILGGKGIISGSFTTKEANELALLLRAGALPAKIEIVQQRSISATLGRESIVVGVKSILVGLFLVCIFMLARYKVFGVVALVSLLVNILCVLAFLSLFQSTLTLPGIAGIVLTIGMAVDGNIIIFENIKQLRQKLQKRNVLEEAFLSAKTSILDANITTILGAVMLYEFGFGSIRGFALTLIIGIIFSIFASLFVTKVILCAINR